MAGGLSIDANGTRDASGKVALGSLVLATGRARIEGNGGFDPGDRAINGTATATLTDLKALSVAAVLLVSGNMLRIAVIAVTTRLGGIGAGYQFGHLVLGSFIREM